MDCLLRLEEQKNPREYKNTNVNIPNIIKQNNITQSMSRVGVSLDNRPIEYFFSILKYEYLGKVKNLSFQKVGEKIDKSIYDYNNIRFQGCLENKTPYDYMVSNRF